MRQQAVLADMKSPVCAQQTILNSYIDLTYAIRQQFKQQQHQQQRSADSPDQRLASGRGDGLLHGLLVTIVCTALLRTGA
jgi:hypothetical protein